LVENRRFEPTPPLFGAPFGYPRWNFAEIVVVSKLEPLAKLWDHANNAMYGVVRVIL